MKRRFLILVLAGCGPVGSMVQSPQDAVATLNKVAFIEPKNHVFTEDPGRKPVATLMQLPVRPGDAAVWGALGRDHWGKIFVGLSCESSPTASARLLAYYPSNESFSDLSDAVVQLNSTVSQNKIHTKPIQAADGKMYFASMDELGEAEDGSKLSTNGSHLWRLDFGNHWQHLGAVPEAVIAIAAGGPYVYYLGYYNHVLYQFDTAKSKIRNQVRVGSVGGHTTRNFVADDRGHVYVPRVSAAKAELIEFDEDLREVKAFPLEGYSLTPDASSHGLVGLTPLKGGAWLFTTDRGKLYRLDPRATGSTLTDLGWLHPQGECYASCLFSFDGESAAVAVGNRVQRGEPQYEWIRFDLKAKTATASALKLPVPEGATSVLAYGSYTRDDAGKCYLGGCFTLDGSSVPAMWCLEP